MIDIHPSSDGRPGRIIERVGRFGSPRKEEIEKGFPEEALFTKNGPNEATLMGAQSTYPVTGGGDWICRKPDHWLFAGTGMKAGDGIPGLVGWEWHGEPAPIPGLEVVASGKTMSPRAEGTYHRDDLPRPARATSSSTRRRSGGPTACRSPRATSGRRSIPGRRAPTPACSASRGTCSSGCAGVKVRRLCTHRPHRPADRSSRARSIALMSRRFPFPPTI